MFWEFSRPSFLTLKTIPQWLAATLDLKTNSKWIKNSLCLYYPQTLFSHLDGSRLCQTQHYSQVRYCEDIGISADAASRLFVYYGVSTCVGRLAAGQVCDFNKVNTFYVYQVAELVVGIGIFLVTMATSYLHMVIFIVVYGFCDGVYITTLNVLLLSCVSPAKTPVAIGWEMQVSSFFLASGPPVAGGSLSHGKFRPRLFGEKLSRVRGSLSQLSQLKRPFNWE